MKRIVALRGLLWGGALLALLSRSGAAHVGLEGAPNYTCYAQWVERPQVGRPGRFVVLWGGFPEGSCGWVKLQLPAGVHLVSGDTVVTSSPVGGGHRWEVKVRCDDPAPGLIRGEMWVDEGNRRSDELSFSLRCSSVSESLGNGISLAEREECVLAGKRFRYGGLVRVPIDAPEMVTQADIEAHGSRARVLSTSPIEADTRNAVSESLSFVVIVAKTGIVRDVRLFGSAARDSTSVALLRRTIPEGWRFAPAKLRGKAYDDWILLRVPVLRK